MLPFDVQDEVFILLLRSHDADGQTFADQQALLHAPGLGAGVHVHPTREILAIEQRFEDRCILRVKEGGKRQKEEGKDAVHVE
jgi:hypothetical protein